ncbi:urotensin-2 isoform 2-T2 [Liasis olivaceus]
MGKPLEIPQQSAGNSTPRQSWVETMDKLGWFCLSLFSLSGQLWAAPRASSSEEVSAWAPDNEDARLNLEALTSRRPFQQALARILGAQTEDKPSKAGLGPHSFSAREYVKEAPVGSFSQNMLLRRLWESTRKQHKKRGNLSECFWKYCV